MAIEQKYKLVKWIMENDEFELAQRLKIAAPFKREIRYIMKPFNTDPFEETCHCRDEYGESFYTKEFFEYPFTDEEKEKFINDQWRHINSPYDCTGMAFTQRIVICNFKEPNSFGALSVVYHFLGIDY